MERKISIFLQKWKTDLLRKPLLLFGPKQVGKTYSVLNFGSKEYKNTVYFNTYNNEELKKIFKKERILDKIISSLTLLSGETILKNDTLLIFDNVNDIEIVKTLKLFGSEKNEYHIILITSRRQNLNDFKGEELNFKSMNELDFEEYLWARDEIGLADLIRDCFEKRKTNPFHCLTVELFHEYLMIGGFPEVVKANLEALSPAKIDSIKNKILDIYKAEVISNPNLIDITRSVEVLESIPEQLKKDNKKFQYGLMGFGKRASEYENCINFLVNNQLVYRSYKTTTIKSPLSSCREKDCFKLYLIDDGLLYSMLHLSKSKISPNEALKETIYENHIAKTLAEAGFSLYYYQSDGKAEVNFVIQNRLGEIIPIEIATKNNSKVKSLSVFMKKYVVKEAYRITENNFATKKEIRYLPIYAIFCLNDVRI